MTWPWKGHILKITWYQSASPSRLSSHFHLLTSLHSWYSHIQSDTNSNSALSDHTSPKPNCTFTTLFQKGCITYVDRGEVSRDLYCCKNKKNVGMSRAGHIEPNIYWTSGRACSRDTCPCARATVPCICRTPWGAPRSSKPFWRVQVNDFQLPHPTTLT